MGGLLQNLWGPQSDFQAQPPGPAELAFRAAGGLLPPPGQLRVANTGPGRFLGGVTRVGGTLGGLIGEEMAKRRTDLLTRVLPPAQEAMAALSGVRIPTEVNVPRGTFPSEPSEESPTGFVSSSGEPAPPTYEFPGTTIQGSRLPRDYQEAFQNLDPKMRTRLLGASAALPNFNPEKLYGEAKYFNPETGVAVIPPRGGPPRIVAQPEQSPAEQIKRLQLQANSLFGNAVVNELNATGKNDWPEAARSVIRKNPDFWSVLGEETKNRILGSDKPTETDKALQDYAQAAGYKDFESAPAKERVKIREKVKTASQLIIGAERQETKPARPGLYIDSEGKVQDVYYEHEATKLREQGGQFLGGPTAIKSKVFNSSNIFENHINEGLQHLNALKDRYGNRVWEYLRTQARVLANDPDAVALYQTLDTPNAIAVMQLYSAQAASLRSSRELIAKMSESGIKPGDNFQTGIVSKYLPMARLNLKNKKDVGLPTETAQQLVDKLEALGKGGKTGTAPRLPGRPPTGSGGTQNWIRDPQTGELRPE